MSTHDMVESQLFYENAYAEHGLSAQRRYPNEELCRFVGGRLQGKEKSNVKILEVGCGTGANLWMLAREGFDVYGLDFSHTAVELCKEIVKPFGNAHVEQGNMLCTPYADASFDVVCDVFSGYCFTHEDYLLFIEEVGRILKTSGMFFFFTPCVTSQAFIEHAPAVKIDKYTLNGIYRQDSPYAGNHYPWFFLDANIADEIMSKAGMQRLSLQRTTRTHHDLAEPFSHLVGVYKKV